MICGYSFWTCNFTVINYWYFLSGSLEDTTLSEKSSRNSRRTDLRREFHFICKTKTNFTHLIWSVINRRRFIKQYNNLSGCLALRDHERHCAWPVVCPEICFANPFSRKRRLKTSFSGASTPLPLNRYSPRKLSRNLNNFVGRSLSLVFKKECINLATNVFIFVRLSLCSARLPPLLLDVKRYKSSRISFRNVSVDWIFRISLCFYFYIVCKLSWFNAGSEIFIYFFHQQKQSINILLWKYQILILLIAVK